MDRRKRVALIVVFSIGLLATIIAACRVYVLAAVYKTGPGADSSGTATWPDFLAVLEPNLNILCISLPMLASLMKRAVGKTTDASSNGDYHRSRSRTFGRGSAADKFRRMDDRSIHLDSMVTKTECRADTRSETGSETALSPSGRETQLSEGGGGNRDTLTDGIRVKRTLQVSVSDAQ